MVRCIHTTAKFLSTDKRKTIMLDFLIIPLKYHIGKTLIQSYAVMYKVFNGVSSCLQSRNKNNGI